MMGGTTHPFDGTRALRSIKRGPLRPAPEDKHRRLPTREKLSDWGTSYDLVDTSALGDIARPHMVIDAPVAAFLVAVVRRGTRNGSSIS